MPRFRALPIEVDAERVMVPTALEGGQNAEPDQWIVTLPTGQKRVYTHDEFSKLYEPTGDAEARRQFHGV